jgi:hypothetical protein
VFSAAPERTRYFALKVELAEGKLVENGAGQQLITIINVYLLCSLAASVLTMEIIMLECLRTSVDLIDGLLCATTYTVAVGTSLRPMWSLSERDL